MYKIDWKKNMKIEEYMYLLIIRKIIYMFLYYENIINILVMLFLCFKKLLVFFFLGNF